MASSGYFRWYGSGTLIGFITQYYTSSEYKPTQGISKAATTGPATVLIEGLGVGMLSTVLPVILICAAIILAYKTGGVYGIALAAVGMLATTGMVVAVDAYGPIADNAGGIAEMTPELPEKVRETTDKLDAVGNTTAAIGKGCRGSAALTALALMVAYGQVAGIQTIDILDPYVIVGLLIGGMLPFFFCAMTMGAVGKAAGKMVEEVRRQFREIKGLLEGTATPDYVRCVAISTEAAIREMIAPGLLAVIAPVLVGFILGASTGGMLRSIDQVSVWPSCWPTPAVPGTTLKNTSRKGTTVANTPPLMRQQLKGTLLETPVKIQLGLH